MLFPGCFIPYWYRHKDSRYAVEKASGAWNPAIYYSPGLVYWFKDQSFRWWLTGSATQANSQRERLTFFGVLLPL